MRPALAAVALLLGGAAVVTESPSCVRSLATCLDYTHPNHANCGTRGGPGCRKLNGQCAAWRDGFVPSCSARRRL